MNKVLNKRLLRELKSNFLRYLALTALIIMGMYIISALVCAAETVITGTKRTNMKNNIEDGRFSVFIPLSDVQKQTIRDKGVTLEEMFSVDISNDSGSVLRVMKTRKDIDLIELDAGRPAQSDSEAVAEKRWCAANGISIGDSVILGGRTLTVTGIGSVGDYDLPVRRLSDVAAQSKSFGPLFVTDSCYDILRGTDGERSEELCYAYRLNSAMSDDELKETIKDFEFDYEAVEDVFFKEQLDEAFGKRDDIKDGLKELTDGSEELRDGLKELDENSAKLNNGTADVFEYFLNQATLSLNAAGINETLTKENYESVLDKYISLTSSEELIKLKSSLDSVKALCDGTEEYTEGVGKAYDGSEKLSEGIAELDSEANDIIDEVFEFDLDNLTSFIKAEDNQRIAAAAGDQFMNKQAGLVAGVIVMILFTYVISVFIIHQIQEESSVIGALYALGVKKKALLVHYITIPTVISFVGGIIGTVIGMSRLGCGFMLKSSLSYFSFAEFEQVCPLYLLIYCIVMPPVVSAVVNIIVINSKLSRTALSLIRNERHKSSAGRIKLKTTDFIRSFRIRQLLRESRTSLTIIFSMIISLLIFMMGTDCAVICRNAGVDTVTSTAYEYMYMLKYPIKSIPQGAEPCYSESLSKTAYGFTLDITVMGIDDDNPYFDVNPVKGKSKVVVNECMAQKYKLKKGDKLILSDSASGMDYAFTVEEVCDHASGLMIFMDIDSMRELFGEEEDYINVLLSNEELDIEDGRLYSVMTKDDLRRSSEIFTELMLPMVITTISASIIIFCTVMYLMMNVMIDHAAFGISLIKIFGYRTKELKKLYLNGNLLTVAVGAVIGIPVSKLLIDLIFPWLVANVACGISLGLEWYVYAAVFAAIMVFYLIINALLVSKLRKITPAAVLKNRE